LNSRDIIFGFTPRPQIRTVRFDVFLDTALAGQADTPRRANTNRLALQFSQNLVKFCLGNLSITHM
jgi:hypothetical protein